MSDDFEFTFDEELEKARAKEAEAKKVKDKKASVYNEWRPQVWELAEYAKNCFVADHEGNEKYAPLIGEQNNYLTAVMGFLMGGVPVMVKSWAGTGKTVLANTLYTLVPEADRYEIEMVSGVGIWYDAKKINAAKYIWFNELQNSADNPEVEKVIKLFGEGRNAHRSVTDITEQDEEGDTAMREQILLWKPWFSTYALGNKAAEKLWNDELSRRVLEIYTDVSAVQTTKIVDSYLARWAKADTTVLTMTPFQREMMKYHLAQCIKMREKIKDIKFPGAQALLDGIPDTFVESRSAIKLLAGVVNGYAVYHYKDRIITKDGVLLVTPQDLWYTWTTYGEMFIQKCLRMGMLSKDVLSLFPNLKTVGPAMMDEKSLRGATELQRELKKNGIMITKPKLQKALEELESNGLIERYEGDSTKEVRFYKSGLSNFSKVFDWKKIVLTCIDVVRAEYPEYAQDYMKRFCTDLNVRHPFEPKTINITTGEETRIREKKAEVI